MTTPICDVASCSRPAPGMMGLCNRHADEYDRTGLWPERYCQTCGLNYCRPGEVECIDCQGYEASQAIIADLWPEATALHDSLVGHSDTCCRFLHTPKLPLMTCCTCGVAE